MSQASRACSVRRGDRELTRLSLGIFGDRWPLLIMREAFSGVRRFDDFRRHLDIARNVLTDRLQRLVEAGVLEQREYQDNPPRSEYRLTDAGRDLHAVMISLMQWGDRWLASPQGPPLARRRPFTHAPQHQPVDAGAARDLMAITQRAAEADVCHCPAEFPACCVAGQCRADMQCGSAR